MCVLRTNRSLPGPLLEPPDRRPGVGPEGSPKQMRALAEGPRQPSPSARICGRSARPGGHEDTRPSRHRSSHQPPGGPHPRSQEADCQAGPSGDLAASRPPQLRGFGRQQPSQRAERGDTRQSPEPQRSLPLKKPRGPPWAHSPSGCSLSETLLLLGAQ